jgi:hypothetical protein
MGQVGMTKQVVSFRDFANALKKCQNSDTHSLVCEFYFFVNFSSYCRYFLWYVTSIKYTTKSILRSLYSAHCILNFMLPAGRPKFAEVCRSFPHRLQG